MEKLRTNKVITLLVIGLAFLFLYLIRQNRVNEIRRNLVISEAVVYRSSLAHRGGLNLFYTFTYKNTLIEGTGSLKISSNLRDLFLNKTFPVVFSSKDPDKNQLLVLPDDFDKYGLKFPENLEWIRDKIK